MTNALIIDSKDSVVVAIDTIIKGTDVNYKFKDVMKTITAIDDIQIYHKIAVNRIKKGEPVIKYGEHIGIAKKDIKIGEHVHIHNVISHRENL